MVHVVHDLSAERNERNFEGYRIFARKAGVNTLADWPG